MPITDILLRSVSGYIFVVPGILLYFWRLKKSGKKQEPIHIACAALFCYYLIGILTMTGIGKLKTFSPRIVLIPFVDMIGGPVDTILNIILFVPLGFFLPLLYKKYTRFSSVALTGFLFSLSIEMIQMFGRGATDINDLITNTAGAYLGCFIYGKLSGWISKKACEKFRADKVSDGVEVLFFTVWSFAVMVTIQPMLISGLFHLG